MCVHMSIYLFKECHYKYKYKSNLILGLEVEEGEVFRGISGVVHLTSMLCHMQRKGSSIRQNIHLKL